MTAINSTSEGSAGYQTRLEAMHVRVKSAIENTPLTDTKTLHELTQILESLHVVRGDLLGLPSPDPESQSPSGLAASMAELAAAQNSSNPVPNLMGLASGVIALNKAMREAQIVQTRAKKVEEANALFAAAEKALQAAEDRVEAAIIKGAVGIASGAATGALAFGSGFLGFKSASEANKASIARQPAKEPQAANVETPKRAAVGDETAARKHELDAGKANAASGALYSGTQSMQNVSNSGAEFGAAGQEKEAADRTREAAELQALAGILQEDGRELRDQGENYKAQIAEAMKVAEGQEAARAALDAKIFSPT